MTEDHAHAHVELTPEDARVHRSIYTRAWLLTFVITFLELVGAWVSGSLAILADIGHVITDSLIALVPLSVTLAKTSTNLHPRHIERIGGILAAVFLFFIGAHILFEASEILGGGAPHHEVSGILLFLFSLGALICNILQHGLLRKISPMHRHAAHSGYHFHVLTDLVKNALLPALGILIYVGVPEIFDAYAAVLIGALVLIRSIILLLESSLGERVVQEKLHSLMHTLFR